MFRHAACRIDAADVRACREAYMAKAGDFLLPPHYAQHSHTWVPVALGIRICSLCGVEHVCFRGECEEVIYSFPKSPLFSSPLFSGLMRHFGVGCE